MGQQVRSEQVKDGEVKRDDLNTAQSGQAVVRKLVAGSEIEFTSTGADAGTGDVTIARAKDNFYYAKSTTETNSTTTHATYLTGTRTVKYTTSYKVTFLIVFTRATISNDAIFQFEVNGTPLFGGEVNIEIKDESNRNVMMLSEIVNLTAGSNTFTIKYRGETSLLTETTMYRANIVVERFD